MSRKFNKIKGLTARKYLDGVENMLLFKGDNFAIEALKKKLTLTNKSVGYRINMLKKDIRTWSKKGGEYGQKRAAKAKRDLEEIAGDLTTEYWVEEKSNVIAPAGFWYLADIEDDFHVNTEIKPFLIEGLRDYQIEAVESTLKYKRSMCVLPTGSGKSFTMTSLAKSFTEVGKRVMIIVPTQDLVDQFIESVKLFHDSVTGAHSSRKPKLGCDIMVTTAGTAKRHIDNYQCVIVDEAAHIVASTWADLLGECEGLEYVYGFTATPFRSDGLDIAIHAFAGPTVFERDLIWAIEQGWLERYDAYCAKICAVEKGEAVRVHSSRANTSAYKKIISNKAFLESMANIVIKAHKNERKIMILFKTLAPARALAKLLKDEIKFSVADANWKKPLRDFTAGKTSILCASSKLVGEGIDIPSADMLIMVMQNSSDGMTYQALGRILRRKEGKKKPILIDVIADGYTPFESAAEKRRKIWLKSADKVTDINI